jgi:octaprenyl-diphosphate synthase
MSIPAQSPIRASAPSLAILKALIASDLAQTNALITAQVASNIPLLETLASHIIAAGGKRIRPSLVLASAALCGYEGERHITLAASVEFIHTATLLHDDVVDRSDLRRGAATANALWGNEASVLVGDFLLSRAFQLMVSDGSLEVLKLLSDAAATISAGEVKQLAISHDMEVKKDDYLDVVHAKTATLFSAACEIGAIVSDQSTYRAPLAAFGRDLGMAFQLVDDALDYSSTNETLGKSIGDDFRDGKITLPVMLAYQRGNDKERQFWKACLEEDGHMSAEHLREAQRYIQAHHAVEDALAEARHYAEAARSHMQHLPKNNAADALIETLDFCVQRAY